MKNLVLIIGLLCSLTGFAQEKINYIDIDELKNDFRTFAENEEYEKIVQEIDRVNKNDSNYIPLLVTKSFYLLQLKKYDDAIKVTNEGLQYPDNDSRLSFYINQSLAFISREDYPNALKTLDDGLSEFPLNYQLYYIKGQVFFFLKKYTDAFEMFKQSAIINPFNPDVHLRLGNLCYQQQLTAQALMCFNVYLMLNPDGPTSFNVLNGVNDLLLKNNPNEKIQGLKISEDDESFEEIDLILNNRVALNKGYKIKNEIDVAFVKQNHALFQQLNNFSANGDFWDKKYVPIFKWISEQGLFDDFVYTTTYSIENPKFQKIVKKKTTQVKKFYSLFKTRWTEIMQENELVLDGKKQTVYCNYPNDLLEGFGSVKNEVPFGSWQFYDTQGWLYSKGSFNENGKRDGEWTWYYRTGKIKETVVYQNGLLEGKNRSYYKNGRPYHETSFANDLLNGIYKSYNKYGSLIEDKEFKNGELDGKYTSWYGVGDPVIEYDLTYSKGKPVGEVVQYAPNGTKIFEVAYQNGEKQGIEKKYYPSGAIKFETEFANGKFHGIFRGYHKNGVLIEEGTGVDNQNSGVWKEYYPDGKRKNEYTYKNGKTDGAYFEYAPDGKLHYEYTYKKGELIAYKFFARDGSILKESQKKDGAFLFEGYATNGNKTTEGLYNLNGGAEGTWKYYNDNGTLLSVGNFKNNNLTGEYTSYHKNGDVESIYHYVNDTLSGYFVAYHQNGRMSVQGMFKDGEQHDEWRYYFPNQTIKAINFFHQGKLHGEQKVFSAEGIIDKIQLYEYGHLLGEKIYFNGFLLKEINFNEYTGEYRIEVFYQNRIKFIEVSYKNGLRHGPYLLYDIMGRKIMEGDYINGKVSGKWFWYYSNGKTEREATFIDGEYHGFVYNYDQNGNLEDKYEYNLGDLVNTSYSYAEDGKTVITTTEYLDGKQHGRKVFYSNEGKLQLIRYYEYDRLTGFSYLDKEGKEMPVTEIKNETHKIVSYFDNGHKAREMEIVNGDVINEYKSYYYNGVLHTSHVYKNDGREGKSVIFDQKGKPLEEIYYQNDEKNGLSIKYYPNGQVKEQVNYANNNKSGEAKYYNQDGTLLKVEKYFNGFLYDAG